MIKSFFRVLIILVAFSFSAGMFAQVTTSGLKGRVLDQNKQPLPGTTVVAVHQPSGTQYGTITNNDGYYQISGMRTGGPYKVDVSFIGYSTASFEGVQLSLGDDYPLNVTLAEVSVAISDVVVQAARTVERTGTNTSISSRQIQTMPTISRSINDFTRVSPYAGSGNSFAGRDGRFNNITIDGAAFNNNFGLSSKNLPGGDAQPISLDAIEEISVNVSPFDIRQSNFTGASINAVTKSGDNKLKVSAYTFMRPKSFTGDKVGDKTVANANEREANTYGMSIGAPIIKNKLFFFVNGEIEKEEYPGIEWKASTNGVGDAATKTSRTTEADLETMRNFLINTYNYDPGNYKGFGNFASENYKIMARVDWNINNNHKFTIRYNDVKSTNDQAVNANSAPNPRSTNRFSTDAMSFSNSNYNFTNYVRSLTGEINSKFGKLSNKLLVSYTHIQDTRGSNSDLFPFVDIQDGDAKAPKQYMNFGYELFTYNNDVINNTFNVTDNLTIDLGKHQLLAGISFDRLYFMNSYLRYALGYYRYKSMSDFMTNQRPIAYGLTYGYNGNEAPGAELTFGLGAMYVQDTYSVNENLKVTGGLRFERPFYFDDPADNPAISALTFAKDEKIDVSKWPDAKVVVLPRLGFNWDVNGDRSLIVRGGSGLFSGLLPFVWYTNQPTNSGVLQNTVELTGNNVPTDLVFERDWRTQVNKYPNLFPSEPASKAPGSIAAVSKDFKLPKVWRSTLGFDYQLPFDLTFTGEFMYSKDIQAVVQENINERDAGWTFTGGADNRQIWFNLPAQNPNVLTPVSIAKANRINTAISNAMVLKNTDKGYQYSLMAQLTKKFSYGLSGMVAYTYSAAKDMTSNPGSSANSAWSSNVAVNSLNTPGLSYSNFQVPHRVVGSINYRVEYFNHLATSVALLYTGSHSGRMSYTYSNDLNGDGNSSDLMYIPRTKDELMFADIVDKSNNVVATAQDQRDAFWSYVESDKYLREHKGEYAERFGKIRPWRNRFDLKIAQELFSNLGASRKGVLTVSLDVLNVGNLINKDWGLNQYFGKSNYDNIQLLTVAGYQNNQPVYKLNASNIDDFKNNARFVDNVSTSSTWGMLLGLKLSF